MKPARRLKSAALADFTARLHQVQQYVQTVWSPREKAHNDELPSSYRMVIHGNKTTAIEHIRQYNGPNASDTAAVIFGNKDKVIKPRGIVIRSQNTLYSNWNVMLCTASVSLESQDPLSYVLLSPNGESGCDPKLCLHHRGRPPQDDLATTAKCIRAVLETLRFQYSTARPSSVSALLDQPVLKDTDRAAGFSLCED